MASNNTKKAKRRYDIDWLRILAMLSIFLFHVARFFNDDDWHVKNPELSFGATVFVRIVVVWVMPLFFIISGMGTYYALGFRTKGRYIQERFKRLIVPFLLGTFIVLIPVQVWIERVSHGDFQGSFFEFYPYYFKGYYAFGGNFAWMGLHLWFLEFLFIFSLISLPLFMFLRRNRMQNLIHKVAEYTKKTGFIFLLAIPIILMELLVNQDPEGIGMRAFGGWSLATYLVFFILGYIIASDIGFKEGMEKTRWPALIFVLLIIIPHAFGLYKNFNPGYITWYSLYALGSWVWLVAIFGFASMNLSFNNRYLKYGNKAVLPFYILQQTVIVYIGFLIANWNIGVLIKYIILGTTSFATIMILYEYIIRRIETVRFLFGMRPKNG